MCGSHGCSFVLFGYYTTQCFVLLILYVNTSALILCTVLSTNVKTVSDLWYMSLFMFLHKSFYETLRISNKSILSTQKKKKNKRVNELYLCGNMGNVQEDSCKSFVFNVLMVKIINLG